jgi:MSHA pilin protein MshB
MNASFIMKSRLGGLQQMGFTLVELVIVIVLLGLLAASALPRFLNITDQAQSAAVEGMSGGFATGVALVKAQWSAKGNSTGVAGQEVVMDGSSIYTNENGWPAKTASSSGAEMDSQTAEECLEVWNFVLQSPPAATAGASLAGFDYQVTAQSANPDFCQFTLVINDAVDSDDRNFIYNVGTGQVLVSVPE